MKGDGSLFRIKFAGAAAVAGDDQLCGAPKLSALSGTHVRV